MLPDFYEAFQQWPNWNCLSSPTLGCELIRRHYKEQNLSTGQGICELDILRALSEERGQGLHQDDWTAVSSEMG